MLTRFYFLDPGDVPLHLSIREASDVGRPVVVSQPDSEEVMLCNHHIHFGIYSIIIMNTHNITQSNGLKCDKPCMWTSWE